MKIKIILPALILMAGIYIGFASSASAAITLGSTTITSDAALTLTGASASVWDLGGAALSLQTAGNGTITTGTGIFTTGGELVVTGNFRNSEASTNVNLPFQFTKNNWAPSAFAPLMSLTSSVTSAQTSYGISQSITRTSAGGGAVFTGGASFFATSQASNTGTAGAFIGGSSSGAGITTATGWGLQSNYTNGGAGTTTNAYAVESTLTNSSTSTIGAGAIFRGRWTSSNAANTATTLKGLDLSGWSKGAASTITTSYGIYMDTTIDVGTTKYALYSLSVSDSYLAGNLGIANASPQSALHVGTTNSGTSQYIQIDSETSAPAAGDCDADAERGRMIHDFTAFKLYICGGAARGWDSVDLTN